MKTPNEPITIKYYHSAEIPYEELYNFIQDNFARLKISTREDNITILKFLINKFIQKANYTVEKDGIISKEDRGSKYNYQVLLSREMKLLTREEKKQNRRERISYYKLIDELKEMKKYNL